MNEAGTKAMWGMTREVAEAREVVIWEGQSSHCAEERLLVCRRGGDAEEELSFADGNG